MNDSAFFLLFWPILAALVTGIVVACRRLAIFSHTLGALPVWQGPAARTVYFFKSMRLFLLGLAGLLVLAGAWHWNDRQRTEKQAIAAARSALMPTFEKDKLWKGPDAYLAATDPEAGLIGYGRDLIAHTQDYFGPSGLVRPDAINGMNCQNCHLDAGSKPFGNNYFGVQSMYPQMRARSGSLETIPKRINDCFQRSLNGQPLDSTSREMLAIMAYMRWPGTGVPKGEKPKGSGLKDVPFLDRAADPEKGRLVYQAKCTSCHGPDGQGLPMPESARWYPPLWGEKSYNEGAGLYRLSRFAAYVKANMPFGARFNAPQLSDEEAWDVAAFVNSQPRPAHPFLQTDWPDISKKPYDHPFGPYKDTFPESRHKYGPFQEIIQ